VHLRPSFKPRDFKELYDHLLQERAVRPAATIYQEDGWGHAYMLTQCDSDFGFVLYVLTSAGRDAAWGTEDDLFHSVLIRYSEETTQPATRPGA